VPFPVQCGIAATSHTVIVFANGSPGRKTRIGMDGRARELAGRPLIHILGNLKQTLCGLRLRQHSVFQWEPIADIDTAVALASRGEKITLRKPTCRACIRLYEQMRGEPRSTDGQNGVRTKTAASARSRP